MFKIGLTTLLLLLFLTLGGCPSVLEPDGDSTITIINNSNMSINFYFDTSSTIERSYNFKNYPLSIIKPNNTQKSYSWWKRHFNVEGIEDMHLFFFDKAVVDSVQWDTIRANNMYLKRIDFTKATLDSLNWTLTYP